jgi:hypothetical protein
VGGILVPHRNLRAAIAVGSLYGRRVYIERVFLQCANLYSKSCVYPAVLVPAL